MTAPIEGFDLKTLLREADAESRALEADKVRRAIRQLNGELSSLATRRDQLERELAGIVGKIETAQKVRERISDGDWTAIPKISEPTTDKSEKEKR